LSGPAIGDARLAAPGSVEEKRGGGSGDVAGGDGRQRPACGVRHGERSLLFDRLGLAEQVFHEERQGQRPVGRASALDQLVHGQRSRQEPGLALVPVTQGRDAYHPDSQAPDRPAGRAGEVQVIVLGAARVAERGRGHEPEHAVSARERLRDRAGIAVGTLHHLSAGVRALRQPGGIAGDHADRLAAVQDAVQDLPTDLAGRRGDDDHEYLHKGWLATGTSRRLPDGAQLTGCDGAGEGPIRSPLVPWGYE
jgi:hypothetical protein